MIIVCHYSITTAEREEIMKRKILTLALCAALALCVLPMAAFADGNVAKIVQTQAEYPTLQDAVNAAPTDGTLTTITLLGNASGDGVVVNAGQNIIFDLGGFTYDVNGETVGSPNTETNGFQLLKGSTVTFQNGTIKSSKAIILIQNYCDLTLTDVFLDGSSLQHQYVLSNNNGSAKLLGNTSITAPEGAVAFDMYYWPKNGYVDGVKVTVNTTGTITGKIEYTRDDTSNDQTAAEKNVLNIENIKHEGTFNVAVSGANINISGGTFSQEVPADFLADGFAPAKNPDTGKYEVTQLPVIATVDNKDYYSLSEAAAAAAASAGKTLTLKANATLDSMLTINTPGMVIDLGGFTVSASTNFQKDASNNNNHLVDITADNVVLKNGTLKAGGNNNHTLNVWNAEGVQLADLTLDNTATYGGAPLIVGASDVTVNGALKTITGDKSWYAVNVDSRNVSGTPTAASLTVADGAKLAFEGKAAGGIFLENSAKMTAADVEVTFKPNVTIASSISGFVPVSKAPGVEATVTDPGNAGLQDNGDGTFGVKPAPQPTAKPSGDGSSAAPAATAAPAPVLDATPKTGAVSLSLLPLAGFGLAGLGAVSRKRR